jgi:hypothetical protein
MSRHYHASSKSIYNDCILLRNLPRAYRAQIVQRERRGTQSIDWKMERTVMLGMSAKYRNMMFFLAGSCASEAGT